MHFKHRKKFCEFFHRHVQWKKAWYLNVSKCDWIWENMGFFFWKSSLMYGWQALSWANPHSSSRPIAHFVVEIQCLVCDCATPPIIKKLWSKGVAIHAYGVSTWDQLCSPQSVSCWVWLIPLTRSWLGTKCTQFQQCKVKFGSPPCVHGFVMYYGRVAERPWTERSLLWRDRWW